VDIRNCLGCGVEVIGFDFCFYCRVALAAFLNAKEDKETKPDRK